MQVRGAQSSLTEEKGVAPVVTCAKLVRYAEHQCMHNVGAIVNGAVRLAHRVQEYNAVCHTDWHGHAAGGTCGARPREVVIHARAHLRADLRL